jgi:hypothetical protein
MAIDDAAGRKAVREKRSLPLRGESVFVPLPRHSSRPPITVPVTLRPEVHQRALGAVRAILRARASSSESKP